MSWRATEKDNERYRRLCSERLDSKIACLDEHNASLERRIERIFEEAHAFFARYDKGEPQPPDRDGLAYGCYDRVMGEYEKRCASSTRGEHFDPSEFIVSCTR